MVIRMHAHSQVWHTTVCAGVCKPTDIGPIGVQTANGVIDIVVKDEAEAVAKAKQYLRSTPRKPYVHARICLCSHYRMPTRFIGVNFERCAKKIDSDVTCELPSP